MEDQRRLASRGAFTDQVKAFLSLHKSSEQCPVFGFRMEEILVFRPGNSDIFTDLPEDLPADAALTGRGLLHKEFQALLALVLRLCGDDDEILALSGPEQALFHRFPEDLRLVPRKVAIGKPEYAGLSRIFLQCTGKKCIDV